MESMAMLSSKLKGKEISPFCASCRNKKALEKLLSGQMVGWFEFISAQKWEWQRAAECWLEQKEYWDISKVYWRKLR